MGKIKSCMRRITIDQTIACIIFILLFFIPLTTSLYSVQIFGKYLTYMILALGLDLLWGSAGLMNLGFGIFFGIGSYIFGISMAVQKGLPAFMSFGGITQLPWFYAPLTHPWAAAALSIVIPALVAAFLGYFIFKSHIKGVFYSIITLAFVALFELFIINQQVYTGGASGINGIVTGLMQLQFLGSRMDIKAWYYIAFCTLLLVYLFCWAINRSRFGQIIHAIRDDEMRVKFLGYDPSVFKIMVFALSAAIAGLAGMLYVPIASFVSVDNAGVAFSTMLLVWLAVGGRGNLSGAMVGALLVSVLQNVLSGMFGGMWQVVLGVGLLGIVLFLPRGLVGSLVMMQYIRRVNRPKEKNGMDPVDDVAQVAACTESRGANHVSEI